MLRDFLKRLENQPRGVARERRRILEEVERDRKVAEIGNDSIFSRSTYKLDSWPHKLSNNEYSGRQ